MKTPETTNRSPVTARGIAFLCLALAALPAAAGVSNITQHTYFTSITGAVAAAVNGDVLNISTGVYAENVVINARSLLVRGGYAMDCATVLPGTRSHIRRNATAIDIGGSSWCVLSNLEVSAASNSGLYIHDSSVVTCNYCYVHGNSANWGGGLDVRSFSTVTLIDCSVEQNTAAPN